MKKTLALILVFVMCILLCACGNGGSTTGTAQGNIDKAEETIAIAITEKQEDFPYIGTWVNDKETLYMRVQEGGILLVDSVATSSSTHTVNGVTTSSTSKSIMTNSYSWMLSGEKFLFNGVKEYTPEVKDGQYYLVSDSQTFMRIGEVDYEIDLGTDGNGKDIREEAVEYSIGTTIAADGFELTLTECGLNEDIRVTSKSSGIQITAGPSVESGKQYVYLKGTLKNTSTISIKSVIGGTIYLDEYEFNLQSDTIATSGNYQQTVSPLETVHILLYAQISDEMAGLFNEGKIVFGFNNNFANVELANADYLYFTRIVR